MSFRKHVSQWQDWGNPPGEKGDYMERLVDGILNDSGNMGDAAEYSTPRHTSVNPV